MTNSEAVKNCDECKLCYAQGTFKQLVEATVAAIKALEKQKVEPINITWSDKTQRKQKLYCRKSGYLCEFATEYGYCQITVCVRTTDRKES